MSCILARHTKTALKMLKRAIGFKNLPLTEEQVNKCQSLFVNHMVIKQFDHIGESPVMFLFAVDKSGKTWSGSYASTDHQLYDMQDWFRQMCGKAGIRPGRLMMRMLSIHMRAGWRQYGYLDYQFISVVVDGTIHARWMPGTKKLATAT
jgi:hypothetical protein